MQPRHNSRRKAQVHAVTKKRAGNHMMRYADAARYTRNPAHTVTVMDHQETELTAATICTNSTNSAEEIVIAR